MMGLKKVLLLFLVLILSISIYGCKLKKVSNIKNHITPQLSVHVKDGGMAPPVPITTPTTTTAPTPITTSAAQTTPNAIATPTSTQPVHTHSWTTTKLVEPTCTSGGYTLKCCSCGETQKINVKSPLGHNLGPWETVTPPTADTAGVKKRTCSRCSYSETEAIPKLTSTVSGMINEVFRIVNEQRAANGLSKLIYRSDLQKAADIRAEEILNTFSHTRPDGNSCFTVFKDIGVNYTWAGENIAKGYATPGSVMDGWMNSPGHRDNILKPEYKGIIIGVKKVDRIGYTGYAWVQLFITQ